MDESLNSLNPELSLAGTTGNISMLVTDSSNTTAWNTPCYTYSTPSWPKSKTIKLELTTTNSSEVFLPKLATLLAYIHKELNWDIDNFKFRS